MDGPDLRLEDCVNAVCPWSGKPVSADSLTLYRGHVVGFCNPGCGGAAAGKPTDSATIELRTARARDCM